MISVNPANLKQAHQKLSYLPKILEPNFRKTQQKLNLAKLFFLLRSYKILIPNNCRHHKKKEERGGLKKFRTYKKKTYLMKVKKINHIFLTLSFLEDTM